MEPETRALTIQEKAAAIDLANPKDVAFVMAESKLFKDIESFSQALVKIEAGRELGLGAFASMQAFDIVEGKLRVASAQLASWTKAHPLRNYKVREAKPTGCSIEWFERDTPEGEWESVGFSEWTEEDRDRAGTKLKTSRGYPTVWAKFPTAMMFNRALSNGVAMYAPDVVPSGNRVYTPGDDFGPRDIGYHERTGEPMEPVPPDDTGPLETCAPCTECENYVGHCPACHRDGDPKPKRTPPMATKDQKTLIMTRCRECGIDDDKRHEGMKARYGVESIHDLTKEQAGDFIEWLAVLKAKKEG